MGFTPLAVLIAGGDRPGHIGGDIEKRSIVDAHLL